MRKPSYKDTTRHLNFCKRSAWSGTRQGSPRFWNWLWKIKPLNFHGTLMLRYFQGLEEDFVSLRQSDSKMTGAMFQYLLSLSRLLSLSYGCGQLSLELWSQAKHFDQLRRQRLNWTKTLTVQAYPTAISCVYWYCCRWTVLVTSCGLGNKHSYAILNRQN